jgi:hypothetical protein
MATWQFQSHLNPNQTLSVPPDVATQLHPDEAVQVVIVSSDSDEDADWRRLAAEEFLKGYAPGDDIYDQLPDG